MRHIKTVICENCGNEFESRACNAKYCSRRCANQRHEENRKAPRTFRCPHNREVTCEKRQCDSCGWNPDVAQRRMDKLMGRV